MNAESQTRRSTLGRGLAGIAVAWAIAPLAEAQAIADGRVASRAFGRLPSPLVVEVSPLDDAPENLRVRDEMRRVLQAAGHQVVDRDARLRLNFATEVRSAAPQRDEARPPVASPDATLPDQPLRPPRVPPPGAMSRSLRYVINATLDDSASGKRLWQGNVRYDDADPNRARLLVRLVPFLLAELGKTVTSRQFTLE